ncbi:hypothetical protein [Leptospira santarosai]|uniref:Uncharacterized protein n=2 Tax=Leptospira santarosai TaxID=28183 RepID=M6URN1_9LEPT|nr:hypothetical protein [Leptospira santarosai]EKO33578.1 hypothetical protein LEP1GSC179_1941 [Leptospira santarosai str. MOR084]EMO43704.1 hypothetical protein LEP1GSC187_2470 [Leptospira santarosai str. ZUN179]
MPNIVIGFPKSLNELNSSDRFSDIEPVYENHNQNPITTEHRFLKKIGKFAVEDNDRKTSYRGAF